MSKPLDTSTPYTVSTPTLIKVTGAALLGAAVILVLFVLPAERGIDLTGAGKAMGLTSMTNAEDVETPDEASAETAEVYIVPAQTRASIVKTTPLRSDEQTLTLAPHSGAEIKAHMKTGDHFIYSWTSTAPVKADMHAEKKGDTSGDFTEYWKDKGLSHDQGALTAPFEGTHGWYFRNQGKEPLTVTVKTSGFYQDLVILQVE
ncbi:hypothetical protein [Asticcacaulis sp. YBE204]|uniref:hypothetical protein n=1 Tax=Asticcacaulis sp. YBE204 TaxID=1282363 RepID=UPI0003C3D46C|nr:hypothetical protein [Asticcacaulis sp. YBE204]ESQ79180.1 hypothetical protein AEYBE204_09225 [Asticcacaulis sp. YBE204]